MEHLFLCGQFLGRIRKNIPLFWTPKEKNPIHRSPLFLIINKEIDYIRPSLFLSTPHVYTKSVSYDQFQHLKSALNQNPELVKMDDEYWRDPGCAAHVLRTFLLELPMPLLHTDVYEPLIKAVREGMKV